MTKINIFQVLNLINSAMMVVESIKSKVTKKERIEEAIDLASPFVQAVEVTFGKDLLKEASIKPFVEEFITASKNLVNAIKKFQDLKAEKPQV